MGMKCNSNHFKGTNGSKIRNSIKLDLQRFAKFPSNESQIKHIMRNEKGHLIDNARNRSLLIKLSQDKSAFLGKDKNGNEWYSKRLGSKQLWVIVRNDIIQNGGLNDKPLKFIPELGLKVKLIRRK